MEVPRRSVVQFVIAERAWRSSVAIILQDFGNCAAHLRSFAHGQVSSLARPLEQLPEALVCGKGLRFPVPRQILWNDRFLDTQQWSELEIDSAPESCLLGAMQLNLRMTEPIVEGHDGSVRQHS